MTNKRHAGFLLMVLAAELAGCNDAGATSPTAAALPQPTPTPAPPTPSGPGYAVADVTLSGVVFEMTPTGRVPIEGARVYLADDQDIGTDTNGFFSFRPVWVCRHVLPVARSGSHQHQCDQRRLHRPAGAASITWLEGPRLARSVSLRRYATRHSARQSVKRSRRYFFGRSIRTTSEFCRERSNTRCFPSGVMSKSFKKPRSLS